MPCTATRPRARGPFVALNTAAVPPSCSSRSCSATRPVRSPARRGGTPPFEQRTAAPCFSTRSATCPCRCIPPAARARRGEFYRVGGRDCCAAMRASSPRPTRTSRKVAQGAFRADLLNCLDVWRIALPPLRERREDFARLAATFLAQAAASLRSSPSVTRGEALAVLERHDWPARRDCAELCRRLAVMGPGREILRRLAAFADRKPEWPGDGRAVAQLRGDRLREGRRRHLRRCEAVFDQTLLAAALEATGGHRRQQPSAWAGSQHDHAQAGGVEEAHGEKGARVMFPAQCARPLNRDAPESHSGPFSPRPSANIGEGETRGTIGRVPILDRRQ